MESRALWRRLDTPGHDACRLFADGRNWRLEGTAIFRHGNEPAVIDYAVECDDAWRTTRGRVSGWIGDRTWDLAIARSSSGAWTVGSERISGLEDCVDLDLGFTPATNHLQLKRCNLKIGESAGFAVAWMDLPEAKLQRLPQRYMRESEHSYRYESPTVGYAELLEIDVTGFVKRYPGLWVLEPAPAP